MSRKGTFTHLREVQEAKRREAEAAPRPDPVPGPESAPGHIRTPTPVQPAPGIESAPGPELGPGWTPFLNDVWDRLAPTLDPLDVVVLAHLLRLTVGHRRETCKISLPRLAERANVSKTTVRASVRRLRTRGLVSAAGVENAGTAAGGTVFRVHLPAPELGRGAKSTPGSKSAPGPNPAPMKDSETKVETAPDLYEIRKAAARVHEAEPDLPHAELVTAVRRAFVAEGRAVTEGAIEDAIRGLAL